MNKKEKIAHIVKMHADGTKMGKTGHEMGLNYFFNRDAFYFDIEDERFWISQNELADLPDGVGDKLADEIKRWAQLKN